MLTELVKYIEGITDNSLGEDEIRYDYLERYNIVYIYDEEYLLSDEELLYIFKYFTSEFSINGSVSKFSESFLNRFN